MDRRHRAREPSGPQVSSIVVALGLLLGPAEVLGLARFAYALVLPAMRRELHWSFTAAGSLNTANAVGYLAGALLVPTAVRHGGERRWFLLSMVITAVAVLASAATGSLTVLLVLRVVSGVSGAICFVIGGGLTAQAGREGSRRQATLLLAVYFAGPGVGIVLSGLVVPSALDAGNWQTAWVVLGLLCFLCLAGAWPAARAVPETDLSAAPSRSGRPRLRPLGALLVCYGLFGAGYIAYMTFVVAALTKAGAGATEVTVFWVVLGATSAVAALVWGRVLAVLRVGVGLFLVLLVLVAGAILPVLDTGSAAAMASAVLFGAAFLTVVTAMTAAARRALPAHQWTTAFAVLTATFALGQCAGPVLSGVLSDQPGGVRLGLLAGAVLLGAAAVVAPFHELVGGSGTSG